MSKNNQIFGEKKRTINEEYENEFYKDDNA